MQFNGICSEYVNKPIGVYNHKPIGVLLGECEYVFDYFRWFLTTTLKAFEVVFVDLQERIEISIFDNKGLCKNNVLSNDNK